MRGLLVFVAGMNLLPGLGCIVSGRPAMGVISLATCAACLTVSHLHQRLA